MTMRFQNSASYFMDAIVDFHNDVQFYLIVILVLVGWQITSILVTFSDYGLQQNAEKRRAYLIQSTQVKHFILLEIVWTVVPILVLIFIGSSSFSLLYALDAIPQLPDLTLKVIGHQWYWTYETADSSDETQHQAFDSYMIPAEDLEYGRPRLLSTDRRVVLPTETVIRVLLTSTDVIHSWAVPTLGIKMDCVPGRINQAVMYISREGTYYGQCSELCGANHGFMPIEITAIDRSKWEELYYSPADETYVEIESSAFGNLAELFIKQEDSDHSVLEPVASLFKKIKNFFFGADKGEPVSTVINDTSVETVSPGNDATEGDKTSEEGAPVMPKLPDIKFVMPTFEDNPENFGKNMPVSSPDGEVKVEVRLHPKAKIMDPNDPLARRPHITDNPTKDRHLHKILKIISTHPEALAYDTTLWYLFLKEVAISYHDADQYFEDLLKYELYAASKNDGSAGRRFLRPKSFIENPPAESMFGRQVRMLSEYSWFIECVTIIERADGQKEIIRREVYDFRNFDAIVGTVVRERWWEIARIIIAGTDLHPTMLGRLMQYRSFSTPLFIFVVLMCALGMVLAYVTA